MDDLSNLNMFCKKEIIEAKFSASINLTKGKSVYSSTPLINISMSNGQRYNFIIEDDDNIIDNTKVLFLYENGTYISNLSVNTLYSFTASRDVEYISSYIPSEIINENGIIKAILYEINETENSLEKQILDLKNDDKINNIENDISYIKNDINFIYNHSLILNNIIWENGQFNNNGDKIAGNAQRRTKNPIKVGVDKIKISASEDADINIYILELDEDKSKIKDLYRITTSEIIISNKDCTYINIMLYSTTITQEELDQYIVVEYVGTDDENSFFDSEDTHAEIDELNNNLLGDIYFTINSKLTQTSEIDRQVGLSVSDFISIPSFDNMIIYSGYSSIRRVICFYNENKEFLGWRGIDGIDSENRRLSYTDIFGGVYLRFTFVTNYDARVILDGKTIIYRKYSYLITNNNNLPSYYNDYMIQKTIRINELASGIAATGDIFVFITDEHWTLNQKNSIPLIGYLNEKCHFNKIFSGGDTADSPNEEFCNNLRKAFPHSIYHVAGNHDWFPESGDLIYYYFDSYNTNQIGNLERQYYYIDDEQKSIRYIILNRFRKVDDVWINAYTDQDQLDWLQNNALNIQEGWSIIIFSHWFEGFGTACENLRQIFDNAKNNGKDIIAIFSGHAHYDAIWHTEGGIPIIVTTCDKNGAWISNGTDMEPWLTEQRITGTINEQAFDVVLIDKKQRKIIAVRIGAPAMDNTDITYSNDNWSYENILEEREILY